MPVDPNFPTTPAEWAETIQPFPLEAGVPVFHILDGRRGTVTNVSPEGKVLIALAGEQFAGIVIDHDCAPDWRIDLDYAQGFRYMLALYWAMYSRTDGTIDLAFHMRGDSAVRAWRGEATAADKQKLAAACEDLDLRLSRAAPPSA